MKRLVGKLLRGVQAGERHLAWSSSAAANAPPSIAVASPAFAPGQPIPARHAGLGVGDNLSPPLEWSGVPVEAVELVLIVEDPGAPLPRPFVHAVATAIAPSLRALDEGALSASGAVPRGLVLGRNTFGKAEYAGPRPIPGHGQHSYVFQLFALSAPLPRNGRERLRKRDVIAAMDGLVLARGRLDGTYER
jgi:Raf kinase inhibitor-like YbhB/YbcL family protein